MISSCLGFFLAADESVVFSKTVGLRFLHVLLLLLLEEDEEENALAMSPSLSKSPPDADVEWRGV